MANRTSTIRRTWQKVDAITYLHTASGMRVVKMADNTWSTSNGPVENIALGLAQWISHKYRTLREAKSSVGIHHQRNKRAVADGYWAGIRSL